jgi:hypothetical protein
MILIKPVEMFTELLLEDFKDHWKDWLKFLFVETPIGWVVSGMIAVQTFLVVSTILYWVR